MEISNIKKFMETNEYQNKRAAMQAEINSYPIDIDRSCFKKTLAEKEQLATAKMNYKIWLKNNPTDKN